MMLPEHVRALNNLSVDLVRVKKPQLDDQEWEQINETLHIAIEYNHQVVFTLWIDGFFKEVEGAIHFIDEINKRVLLVDVKEDVHKINFESIVEVKNAK
ncbi:YolD-like family protein [Siminovitchia terrae]|uniref:YolD-like family protein n=1 Tax=Siminovitchia terrae TaxID=1914933 RepID=A0A429XB47_SIMTE|nr:YolD-like family protein [Siminovitchia terrae]RST60581.1 YolD-like family protein [Siminovitchia terrae]